ncbi:unnamed protein product [Pseudo-nitzschia multistriata]|uniref:Uncharacterized protein n=1 Tax=Pseudo-nitzschia multistriata TaxID=183589 RepID=A0A448YYU2_9STRA|nr:unnamed protein product [Pseudo-nitzschia multistriata]
MRNDTIFFEQVCIALRTCQNAGCFRARAVLLLGFISHIELELNILSESTRVIISRGFRITECFEQRVGIQDTLHDGRHLSP